VNPQVGKPAPQGRAVFSSSREGNFSAVPAGLGADCVLPGVKTPGYCQLFLRNSSKALVVWKRPFNNWLAKLKRRALNFSVHKETKPRPLRIT